MSEELKAACETAEDAVAEIEGILRGVDGEFDGHKSTFDRYLVAWLALTAACEVLGAPQPFIDMPDIWGWVARCQDDLALSSQRALWLNEQIEYVRVATAEIRARIARGEQFPFEARYYQTTRRELPVRAYIDQQGDTGAQILRKLQMLNKLTRKHPFLARPHGAPLEGPNGDGFYELRVGAHRVIYRPYGQVFLLLHAFTKDEDKVPENDKKIAKGRWEDFLRRRGTEPDPLGASAP